MKSSFLGRLVLSSGLIASTAFGMGSQPPAQPPTYNDPALGGLLGQQCSINNDPTFIRFSGSLKLQPTDTAGDYEFALITDASAFVRLGGEQIQHSPEANKVGLTSLVCGGHRVSMKQGDVLPLDVEYLQDAKNPSSLMLVWRKFNATEEALCGKLDRFFTNSPQQLVRIGLDIVIGIVQTLQATEIIKPGTFGKDFQKYSQWIYLAQQINSGAWGNLGFMGPVGGFLQSDLFGKFLQLAQILTGTANQNGQPQMGKEVAITQTILAAIRQFTGGGTQQQLNQANLNFIETFKRALASMESRGWDAVPATNFFMPDGSLSDSCHSYSVRKIFLGAVGDGKQH